MGTEPIVAVTIIVMIITVELQFYLELYFVYKTELPFQLQPHQQLYRYFVIATPTDPPF